MDNAIASSVWPQNIAGWLQIILYVTGIISVAASAWRYWQNSRQRRMKWLYDLYQRFYDNKDFQDISARIESGETNFIENDEVKSLVILDQYLNFFEFVGILWHKKELEPDEIKDMFDYPLRMIVENPAVYSYICKPEYSYKQINELFKELGYTS